MNTDELRRHSFGFVLRRFLETSSVRGLPRIVKSQTRLWRVLWTFCVLGFISAALFQLYITLTMYMQYETLHFQEKIDYYPTEFPSLTVCNLQGLDRKRSNAIKQSFIEMESPWEYFQRVKNVQEDEGEEFPSLMKFSAYYQNVPNYSAKLVGRSLLNFAIQCKVFLLIGSNVEVQDCDVTSSLKIYLFENPNFFNCYTLTVENTPFRVKKIQLILHLDNMLNNRFDVESLDNYEAQKIGVRAIVHRPGTRPRVSEGVDINPGVAATLALHIEEWRKLGEPYGNCTFQPQSNITQKGFLVDKMSGNFVSANIAHPYDRHTCHDLCVQRAIVAKCGCLNANYPIPTKLNLNRFTFCEHLPLSPDEIVQYRERGRCVMDVLDRFSRLQDKDCANCPRQCHYFQYNVKVNQVKWPHRSFHVAFYDKLIRGKEFGKGYEIYGQLKTEIDDCVSEDECNFAYNKLRAVNLIRENFIQMEIVREDFSIQRFNERPEFPIQRMLSSVGGLFSIWNGITFTAGVEVLELLYNIIMFFFARAKQTDGNNDLENENDGAKLISPDIGLQSISSRKHYGLNSG